MVSQVSHMHLPQLHALGLCPHSLGTLIYQGLLPRPLLCCTRPTPLLAPISSDQPVKHVLVLLVLLDMLLSRSVSGTKHKFEDLAGGVTSMSLVLYIRREVAVVWYV